MFGMQLRKIYQSDCRIMVFDALGKPAIPGGIFLMLFFWKNINEFVSRSVLVSGDKAEPATSEVIAEPATSEVIAEPVVINEIVDLEPMDDEYSPSQN